MINLQPVLLIVCISFAVFCSYTGSQWSLDFVNKTEMSRLMELVSCQVLASCKWVYEFCFINKSKWGMHTDTVQSSSVNFGLRVERLLKATERAAIRCASHLSFPPFHWHRGVHSGQMLMRKLCLKLAKPPQKTSNNSPNFNFNRKTCVWTFSDI